MRLAIIEAVSPGGQTVTLQANGPLGLIIERYSRTHDNNVVDIRDPNLPPHGTSDSGVPPCDAGRARLLAQIPITWAIVPTWEYTEPLT